MYKCTHRTLVISDNYRLEPDGFTSIKITNTGDKNMLLNVNINVPANKIFEIKNDPDVVIDFPFFISFNGTGNTQTALIELIYFTQK